jgi:peroxiredoxin (alkyl hydroperoxide reductase subunit C)
MIRIGEQIPDFSVKALVDGEIQTVTPADYAGKWLVMVFYPADFTFICPTELQEAAALSDEFAKLDAQIVSVSTDTVWTHKAWKDQSPSIAQVNYPMLADPTGNLCRAFGTYIEGEGVSLRGTFIIDPDGKLASLEVQDNSVGRSMHETLRKLAAAAFVRAHEGQVCPAGWRPGGETLRPGLDLVGQL